MTPRIARQRMNQRNKISLSSAEAAIITQIKINGVIYARALNGDKQIRHETIKP